MVYLRSIVGNDMTECNGCGMCCDPVTMPWSLNEIKRMMPIQFDNPNDRAFILAHFTPMPVREAYDKLPFLKGRMTFGLNNGRMVNTYPNFYRCDMFDPETRQCTAYDDRPSLCRGYPWYDTGPNPAAGLPPPCEFNRDIGKEPVPIELTKKP